MLRILITYTKRIPEESEVTCKMLVQNKELQVGLPGRLHLLEYTCPVLLDISHHLSQVSGRL